jgi:hypothetical protein
LLLEKIKAFFRSNPEIAAQAGISTEEIDVADAPAALVPATPDPEIAALRQHIIKQAAVGFADSMVTSAKAVPAQRDGIVSTFVALAGTDGTKVANGDVVLGEAVKGFIATISAGTPNKFGQQEINDPKPDDDDKQAAEVERVLAMTPMGQKAAQIAAKENS